MSKALLLSVLFIAGSLSSVQAKPTKTSKTVKPSKDPQSVYSETILKRIEAVDKANSTLINRYGAGQAVRMENLRIARKALQQVQAISVVPKSLAKADQLFGEWALQMDKALDHIKIDDLQGFSSLYDEARVYREQAMDELQRAKNQKTVSKKYVDG